MEKLSCIFNQSFVNDLSNYICQKISNNNPTIISVVDFDRLFVIKGKTTNNKEKNISEIIDSFIDERSSDYSDLEPINIKTIDLIDYDVSQDYFNTETINLSSKKHQISHLNQMIHSNFPNGYFDNSSKIFNLLENIKPYFKYENFDCNISISDNKISFIDLITDSYYKDEKLLSILKDNFDSEKIEDLTIKDKFLNVI